MMNEDSPSDIFRKAFMALGMLAALGLAGYALTYIIVMPKVSPSGFVPTTLDANMENASQFGMAQAVFVLLYAFAFLPVVAMFTVKQYSTNPYALVFAGCLAVLSLLIQILNSLPLLAAYTYPAKLESIPSDVLLYLRQTESIKYLSYDVAAFTIAYVAIFIYAIVYFKSHRWLSYAVFGSIVLFMANVPCLWFAPNLAVTLMAMSILAFAMAPIFLARMAIEQI